MIAGQPPPMNNPINPAGWSRDELEALRAVAMAATPGRWQNGIADLEGVVAPDNPGLGNVICIPPLKRMYSSLEHWPENAAHIATFDPPTVLRLIDAIMALAPPSSVDGETVDRVAKAIGAAAVNIELSNPDIPEDDYNRRLALAALAAAPLPGPKVGGEEALLASRDHDLGASSPIGDTALPPGGESACRHCREGFLDNRFGQDVECVNGILIDIDEYTEGWQRDVVYPVAPCHPMWARQAAGAEDFENDCQERLAGAEGPEIFEPAPMQTDSEGSRAEPNGQTGQVLPEGGA